MLTKRKIIFNQAKLLFIIFGIFALIISLISFLTQGIIVIIHPIVLTFSLTIFCTLVSYIIYYIKEKREVKFFSKNPYSEIEKYMIEKKQVFQDKYDFPRNIRIIEIDSIIYEVLYFDDFFKVPVSNVLIINNILNKESEPYMLNYKKQKFTNSELLDLIKTIE